MDKPSSQRMDLRLVMKALPLLILFSSLSALPLAAQTKGPPTIEPPPVTRTADAWLYTPDRKVAQDFVAKLDAACGYPNPATKTWTSVDIQEIVVEKTTNYAVLVPSVFAPKLSEAKSFVYVQAKTLLPKDRVADVPITDAAVVSTELAKVAEVPAAKDELSQNYVLVTKEIVEPVATEKEETVIIKDPITK